ncbi:MAG: zinc ribbon domain-containing protein [Gammaproteobacteria bacterium]|nr:zinc ribbon domain-containing protein [Gammaproteobacteria bacterium]
MPFYEYECRACETQTEVLQKISDKPLRKCEVCGKNSLVKLVSAPIFRLKGGGWYETDFKSEQDRKRNLVGESDEKPKSESKDGDAAKVDAAKTDASKADASKPDSGKSESAKPAADKAVATKSTRSKAAAKTSRAKPRQAKR